MLLGILGANLLGDILTGEGFRKVGNGSKDLQSNDLRFNKGKGIIRAGYGSKDFWHALIL